jgi:hypothetical protein
VAAPYSSAEVALLWCCWCTPGIAAGGLLAAAIQWFWTRGGEAWLSILFWGTLLGIFIGCALFASMIRARKSGHSGGAGRLVSAAVLFLVAQVFVAPFIAAILLMLIFE